jgi:peptidyl-Lys metalloendopeptidase
VEISLEIAASKTDGQPKVIAHVNFRNETKKPIKIAKFLIGNGEKATNAFFQVVANAAKIQYVGEMAKRAEPKPEDFITLKPKQEVKGSFDISTSYRWLQNVTEYTIVYESFNHFSPDEILLTSHPAKVKF